MTRLSITFVALLGSAAIFAQESEQDLEKRVEDLRSQRELLESQVKAVEEELASAERSLQASRARTLLETGTPIQVALHGKQPLYEEPREGASRMEYIPEGETAIVLGVANADHLEVMYGNLHGFVNTIFLDRSDPAIADALDGLFAIYAEQEEVAAQERERARQERETARQEAIGARQEEKEAREVEAKARERVAVVAAEASRAQRRKELLTKWGQELGATIIDGKVRIGMTAEMARDSWGRPDDVNRTTTAGGVSEQWVYESGNYLYFTDGVLTSIQN